MQMLPLGIYLLVFGAAAVACFASLSRAMQISNNDTRRGLVALLVTSGLWAGSYVGYFIAPTAGLQYAFYMGGLIVGLSTVGPWLYFCSAYTGRTLHRHTLYQQLAVGGYLSIVAIKLTNPYHQLYFTTELSGSTFPRLLIEHQPLHWVVMSFSYSLALIGIFMLFELFAQVDYDVTPFVVLVGLTGLPAVFDIIGFVSPLLLDLSYSSVGVAVFAVGVLFTYLDQFQSIQLAGQYDNPVIVLDDEQRITDYNESAEQLFPELVEAVDDELSAVLPRVAVCLTTGETLELRTDDKRRFYSVLPNQFGTAHARLGQLVILKDITDQEESRLEIEHQNTRLEQFTGMVSHDLRNPLNIAQGNIDLARETGDSESLETVKTALDRMETLIEDLLALARQGKPIDETQAVSLAEISQSCWEMVDVAEAELVVADDFEFDADPDRLQQLFENLFRNSVEHGGETITISVGAVDDGSGFYVEDDGPGIPPDKQDDVFESGYTTSRNGTGFGLSIVKEIVDAHGWTIRATTGRTGGARFEVGIPTDSDKETGQDLTETAEKRSQIDRVD
jgi:signal transduction histidine kinase